MTVLLGTLWSSIKQIEAPYVFDWENAIALDTMQGNRPSSCREGKVSWVFSSCGRNLGYILELRWGWPFKTRVCFVTSCLLSCYEGQLRNLHQACQENKDASQGKAGSECPFLVATVILGFLSIFNKSQASSPFEALNSACLSRFQRM